MLESALAAGAMITIVGQCGVEGTHDYFCIPHKQLGMIGRIVVGDSGGPATRSSNPDGDLPDSERIVEQGSIPYEAFAEDR